MINLHKHIHSSTLTIKVIPNAKTTRLIEENEALKLYLHAVPENNKANKELIRFFKKECGMKVEIISGEKSHSKKLRMY